MIIRAKIKPGAKEESITMTSKGVYVISLKEMAHDGKANRRLINILSKELGINWRMIKIKNPKSRDKIVEVKDEI